MRLNHLGLFATIAAAAGLFTTPGHRAPQNSLPSSARRNRRPAPTMVCSSPAEIAARNTAVDKKKMARHVRRMNKRARAWNAAHQHQLAPVADIFPELPA